MKTYKEIKQKHSDAVNKAVDDNKIFFAFGNEQFDQALKELGEDNINNIVTIGMGGYILKQNVKSWVEATAKAGAEYKSEMKELREEKKEMVKAILYELRNHECFYTGDITDVVNLFKSIYTEKEIATVYKKNIDKY